MKIELIDDTHVKLFLDNTRNSWVVITPCEATSVEEELIGRITTRFASYSTACLVAQHEGVCNEYMEIIKNIKGVCADVCPLKPIGDCNSCARISQAQEALNLLEVIHKEAQKQKDDYVKAEKFELANKSKAQAEKMEDQIKQKRAFIENESIRAESVRSKAEAEAGPVLDMVQIMQNRVQELFHTRVKSVKDKYKVDDLELEEQLSKMQALVRRAKELCTLVARPISEIRKVLLLARDGGDVLCTGYHSRCDWDVMRRVNRPWTLAVVTPPSPLRTRVPKRRLLPLLRTRMTRTSSPASSQRPRVRPCLQHIRVVYRPVSHYTCVTAATPAPSSAAAPTPTPASQAASSTDHDSDVEDWDDIDENNLPAAFAPSGSEIFMTVTSSRMLVQASAVTAALTVSTLMLLVDRGC